MTAGCGGASDTVVVGLTEQFDVARKQPGPEAFRLENISIDSRLVPAIIVRGQTRLTQHVTVPERGGAFRVTFGLEPHVWRAPGDGVRFSIGVSDGRAFREKYVRLVDPYGQPADRRWHEAVVDLREYGGLTIDVVLNTRAGPAASTDVRNDVAVWAQPVIVSR
jgi:hypothetical protein